MLVVVALAACTGPGSSPTSATSAKPTTAATPPASSPSPAQIACELPFLPVPDASAPFTAVGFLKLPEGVFTPDPTATSNLPPGGVQATPVPGGTQPWWDGQAKRWIPVDLSSMSPDGQYYAYLASDGLHRVTVATGADELLYRRPKGVRGGQVIGYEAAGVYIVFPTGVKDGTGGVITNPPAQVGIWKVDVAARTAVRIRTSDVVGSMVGGALWVTPISGGEQEDSLVRIDLSTGQQTPWFTEPGQTIQFLGVDNTGLPIVWTFSDGHLEIWRIALPNQATKIYTVDYTGNPPIFGPEMQQGLLTADAHGVWFGAVDGLYIYDAAGFHKVAATAGIPAGPCT